jgi:uncharacterized coiled-coil protein SlyX
MTNNEQLVVEQGEAITKLLAIIAKQELELDTLRQQLACILTRFREFARARPATERIQ